MTLLPFVDPFPSDPAARVKASSAWYTPDHAADVLASMCWQPSSVSWRILEPSAGHGSLIAGLYRAKIHTAARIECLDLDIHSVTKLRARAVTEGWEGVTVEHVDYLERPAPSQPYDLTITNPPYEDGQDSAHVAKAMDESLRVVALVRLAMLESKRSHERVWSRIGRDGWRVVELVPFIERPSFLAGGEEGGGGKTAFMAIKLSRVPSDSPCTHLRWV